MLAAEDPLYAKIEMNQVAHSIEPRTGHAYRWRTHGVVYMNPLSEGMSPGKWKIQN